MTMNKWMSILLTLASVLTAVVMFALPANAATYSGTCGAEGDGSNLTWTVDELSGVLTIEGKGAMEDYDYFDIPWRSYSFDVTAVILPDGLTNICDDAFIGFSKLQNITIPSSVKVIGESAFDGCSKLTSVTISDGVTVIKDSAFNWCTELTSVEIPNSVISIGDAAFNGCKKLSSITLPDSGISIGMWAFDGTSYYKDKSNWTDGALYIGRHLIEVKAESVSGTYVIKDGTLSIAGYGMDGCENITDVVIPDSVTTIGKSAFWNCPELTSIVIGSGVTQIEKSTFSATKKLENVYIKSPVIANQLTSSGACGKLIETAISVMIADEITTVPAYITENYPYTASETHEGVTYTVYTKNAPPPETAPETNGDVTDTPTTDAPVTDAPVTDAPVTTTAPTTTEKVPTTTAPDTNASVDISADNGEDDNGTLMIVIAALGVCLIGAMIALIVVATRKKPNS